MATLIAKVRAISGSSTTITSNTQVVDFVSSGAKYLLNSMPRELLAFAITDSAAITSGSGYNVLNDRIVSVRRAGVECIEIPRDKIYANTYSFTGTTSIFKGSAIFPQYYQISGLIYIKPDPTALATGVVSYIASPAITSGTSTHLFQDIENPMITYAAALDCEAISAKSGIEAATIIDTITANVSSKLAAFVAALPTWTSPTAPTITQSSTTIPTIAALNLTAPTLSTSIAALSLSFADISAPTITQSTTKLSLVALSVTAPTITLTTPTAITVSTTLVADALSKAQLLIDTSSVSESAEYYLAQEDTEMAQTIVSVAAQEVLRARGEVEKFSASIQNYAQQVGYQTSKYGAAIQKYVTDAQYEINKNNSAIQKYADDVQREVVKWNADLQKYAEQVRQELGKNDSLIKQQDINIQRQVVRWNADLQKFAAQTQYEVNKYVQSLQKYQADIQREVVKWNADLQKYSEQAQNEARRYAEATQNARTYIDAAQVELGRIVLINTYHDKARIYKERSIELLKLAQLEVSNYINMSNKALNSRQPTGGRGSS